MPVPSSEIIPNDVAPSVKVTVPVGMATPEAGETWAVKLRLVPLTALVAEGTSVVVVAITGAVTVRLKASDVLPLKFASPA